MLETISFTADSILGASLVNWSERPAPRSFRLSAISLPKAFAFFSMSLAFTFTLTLALPDPEDRFTDTSCAKHKLAAPKNTTAAVRARLYTFAVIILVIFHFIILADHLQLLAKYLGLNLQVAYHLL